MFTPMLCDNHQCGLRSGFSAERAQYIAIKGPTRRGKLCRDIGHAARASLMPALRTFARKEI
jgi:hypothetical protein